LAPAATVDPHALTPVLTAKLPDAAIEEIVRGTPPVLVSVTDNGELVVFTT
jgi:hypothetical protein